jgi:hypothetical protein
VRWSKFVSIPLLCTLAAACGQGALQSPPPESSSTATELAEPFWLSDNPSRPGRAHAIPQIAKVSRVLQLGPDELAAAAKLQPEGLRMAPRQTAAVTPTRIVTGLYSLTFHQESTTTLEPQDLSSFQIKALVPNAGGFDTFTGTGHTDGTFSIPGVPVGNYWLTIGSNFLWTSNDHVEWVFDTYGRPDVAFATIDPTDLVVNATNLSAWQVTDELQWSVPAHGWLASLSGFGPTPAVGAVALTNYDLNFSELGFPLPDASKGDQAYLCQLTTRTLPGTSYRSLGKVVNLPATTMVDGTSTTVNSGFLDVPQTSSLRLNWKRSALSAMAPQVNPAATVVGTEIGLWVTPLGLNVGVPGTAFQLLTDDSGPNGATTDVDYGDALYGNPFPASWPLLAETYFNFSVSYLAPGATMPAQVVRSAYTATSTQPTATSPIAPQVGPALNPRINGKDLFSNQVAVGTSPAISWDPPSLGVPTIYLVRLLELRNNGGASQILTRASFRTPLTSFTIPPGLMVAGSTYVFTISAQQNPGIQAGEYPFRSQLPFSSAPLMSAIVAP